MLLWKKLWNMQKFLSGIRWDQWHHWPCLSNYIHGLFSWWIILWRSVGGHKFGNLYYWSHYICTYSDFQNYIILVAIYCIFMCNTMLLDKTVLLLNWRCRARTLRFPSRWTENACHQHRRFEVMLESMRATQFSKAAMTFMTIFGSTYLGAYLFSHLNLMKTNVLTDECTRQVLAITPFQREINFNTLARKKGRLHVPH